MQSIILRDRCRCMFSINPKIIPNNETILHNAITIISSVFHKKG